MNTRGSILDRFSINWLSWYSINQKTCGFPEENGGMLQFLFSTVRRFFFFLEEISREKLYFLEASIVRYRDKLRTWIREIRRPWRLFRCVTPCEQVGLKENRVAHQLGTLLPGTNVRYHGSRNKNTRFVSKRQRCFDDIRKIRNSNELS